MNTRHSRNGIQSRRGMATIVMMILLAIILCYIAANLGALNELQSELRLTEKRHINRLNSLSVTNTPNPVPTPNP